MNKLQEVMMMAGIAFLSQAQALNVAPVELKRDLIPEFESVSVSSNPMEGLIAMPNTSCSCPYAVCNCSCSV